MRFCHEVKGYLRPVQFNQSLIYQRQASRSCLSPRKLQLLCCTLCVAFCNGKDFRFFFLSLSRLGF
jgi:hypothetical protein